jgi:hypothetical protein
VLSFYAQYTSRPAYTLLEDNWGQRHDLGSAWQQHQVQYGDLNLDDVVDQKDSEIYNSVMPVPFGWSVGGKVHWYKDCSYIKDKPVRACLIGNNLCLRCLNQKLKGN